MSEKFTPGPWEVINGTTVLLTGAQRRDGVVAAPNDGWQVADTSDGITSDTYGQQRTLEYAEMVANAHLIAAAPDLYAALNRIYNKLMISDRDGESHISEKDGEMALAALCKAMGEA